MSPHRAATSFDRDAYFGRIGWTGDAPVTRGTLARLLAAHMASIPFENLDVLLGRRIALDLPGLQRKLVQDRRGGYCFEHATLFAAALEHLGFRPARHTARVTLFTPRHVSPRTHMFLTVPLAEGTFMVDPGFGSRAPRCPVPVVDAGADPADDRTHWLHRDGPFWTLKVRSPGTIVDAWVSTLEVDNPADFEVGNHYTSGHPASPFVNRLMLRAMTDDGCIAVMNRDVTVWTGLRSQTLQLADRAALRALLREHFGFDLPEVDRLRVPAIPEWE